MHHLRRAKIKLPKKMELTELTRRQTLIQHSPIGKKNQKKVSEKQSNITKKSNGEITQKKNK